MLAALGLGGAASAGMFCPRSRRVRLVVFHRILLVSVLGFAALVVHTYSVTWLKQSVKAYFPEKGAFFRGCVEGYLGESSASREHQSRPQPSRFRTLAQGRRSGLRSTFRRTLIEEGGMRLMPPGEIERWLRLQETPAYCMTRGRGSRLENPLEVQMI